MSLLHMLTCMFRQLACLYPLGCLSMRRCTIDLCLQGTNRPARYNVLVDDNRLGQDGLQLITMYLTSLYFACTR